MSRVPFVFSCGRLAEPLSRYPVSALFHGHAYAHRGSPEGALGNGIPGYSVALPLLRRLWPDKPPMRVIEVAVPGEQK